MKTKLPKSLADHEDIAALRAELATERAELLSVKDEDLTDEQLDSIDEVTAAIANVDAEQGVRDTAAQERANRIAAARAAAEDPEGDEPGDEDPEEPAGDEPVDEEPLEVEIPDDASELEGAELVTASAAKKPTAAALRRRAPAPKAPAAQQAAATMFAAGDLGGKFKMGGDLATLTDLAEAFQARFASMPQNRVRSDVTNRYGVAQIRKATDKRTHITRQAGTEGAQSAVEFAIEQYKASRGFTDKTESIEAAGGWCAPSQTVYNIPGIETVSGILSLPEVTIEHGGIQFTKGPDYATVTANTNTRFKQTEAQAIAGTTKPLYDIECPPFSEARLDAIGFGFRAGILTKAAWPELIGRYEQILTTGFEHFKNRDIITRVVGMLGTALTPAQIGSAFVDSLNSLSSQALRLRYKYSLSDTETIDGFAPIWLKEVFKDDLAYQNGVDRLSVTDAQIDTWLSNRHISLQWVYDWQDSTFVTATPAVTFPQTAQVALYPAGAYVKGSADVISLDAIYDTAGLQVNTYTGMFMEEGVLVYNPVANGVLVTLPIADISVRGRTGAANIGLVALPTT